MGAWWAKGAPGPAPETRAVAYYRHSAQDRQENSIPIQREQVEQWAREHGILIIQEFADYGKSGLSADRRDAFKDMLENWVLKRDDFHYVLVLDVSRWGRFQDTDLSATYSAECTRHGKKVVYTSLGLPKKDDPLHAMMVGFERYRAAQFSRELSEKVFRGCAKVAQQGFRAGGTPPYGLSRLLLNEARMPVQILKPTERKSIQNQRVTLAPGDPHEVAVVRRIFEECARGGQYPEVISAGLNRDGIPSPGGVEWDHSKVRDILTNELYAGTMVYNKSTMRLKSSRYDNPREEWILTPSAFQGIIPQSLYDQAQAVLRDRHVRGSPAYHLEQIRSLYELWGTVTTSLIESNPQVLSVHSFQKRFRSLGDAFQKLFPETRESVTRQVRTELGALAKTVEEYDDFLILDRRLSVLIQPSIPVPFGYRSYWPFVPDFREVVDITLGVLVSGPEDPRILGFLAFPRLLVRPQPLRIFDSSDWRVELYGHKNLDFIKDLLS